MVSASSSESLSSLSVVDSLPVSSGGGGGRRDRNSIHSVSERAPSPSWSKRARISSTRAWWKEAFSSSETSPSLSKSIGGGGPWPGPKGGGPWRPGCPRCPRCPLGGGPIGRYPSPACPRKPSVETSEPSESDPAWKNCPSHPTNWAEADGVQLAQPRTKRAAGRAREEILDSICIASLISPRSEARHPSLPTKGACRWDVTNPLRSYGNL